MSNTGCLSSCNQILKLLLKEMLKRSKYEVVSEVTFSIVVGIRRATWLIFPLYSVLSLYSFYTQQSFIIIMAIVYKL